MDTVDAYRKVSIYRNDRVDLCKKTALVDEVQDRDRIILFNSNTFRDGQYASKALQVLDSLTSDEADHLKAPFSRTANASSQYVRFLEIGQAGELDLEAIYSRDWRHPDDRIAYLRHKSRMCAEFLVPDRLPPEFIRGAYVVDIAARNRLRSTGFALSITIDKDLFFS